MGINDSRKLDYLSDENPFSININSISNGKITYNSDSFYIDINDICINELSDDQLVSLFMDEPTYKPKKIQRII